MKQRSAKTIASKFVICIVIGVVIAALSGLYGRTVLKQHCSTGKDSNIIQCSLEGMQRGLPFSYVLPRLPHSQVKPATFIEDAAIWALVPAAFMVWANRRQHG